MFKDVDRIPALAQNSNGYIDINSLCLIGNEVCLINLSLDTISAMEAISLIIITELLKELSSLAKILLGLKINLDIN